MNLFTPPRSEALVPPRYPPDYIEIIEPSPEDCDSASLPPEGNVKHRNYRLLTENVRTYSPTGDIHTSPAKGKLVSKFDISSTLAPPRSKILELLRPEDPGRDELEAIVRPAPRRGLTRPLDEDTRRFLQRALLSPSPQGMSLGNTPEPYSRTPDLYLRTPEPHYNSRSPEPKSRNNSHSIAHSPEPDNLGNDDKSERKRPPLKSEMSLADELAEAEEEEQSGNRREMINEFRRRGGGLKDAFERDRLGKLALSVEDDEDQREEGLTMAARRLDALLAESRDLHEELAGIHEDIQRQVARVYRCSAAARLLGAESQTLRFLDDMVALLRGDVAAAERTKHWPFAIGQRQPDRNYII